VIPRNFNTFSVFIKYNTPTTNCKDIKKHPPHEHVTTRKMLIHIAAKNRRISAYTTAYASNATQHAYNTYKKYDT